MRTPPSTSPTAPPPPATEPKTPKALARSLGSVNVLTSVESAPGASTAPKTPCAARAATSMPKDVEAPPTAEAIAKPAMPPRKAHLRPNMSPMRPPSSSRLPKASAYEVTIHCRPSSPKCSAVWADGRAMFTMVASSTTMSWATETITRINQR